jgi:NAD(P)-dependent dehydrogenase (short-subunit alcohol dehydrogenase family)
MSARIRQKINETSEVMDLGLRDKVALVTGGSKGIGEGIVRRLLAEGAKVANVNRSTAEGEAMQREYESLGQECYFIQGDLCDTEACRTAVTSTIDRFGRIDILINNAGVNDGVGLGAGPNAFVGSLERNLIHYYALAHFALDELKKSQGVIINIGSKVSVTGQGGTSGYAAAKGAINGLTREWALDLAEFGIRVNAVLPAETWTPLYSHIIDTMPDPAAAKREIENLIPLGRRFTTKEELADMVVFLASPRSSHTTGQIIFVDGGYTHFDRKYTS